MSRIWNLKDKIKLKKDPTKVKLTDLIEDTNKGQRKTQHVLGRFKVI